MHDYVLFQNILIELHQCVLSILFHFHIINPTYNLLSNISCDSPHYSVLLWIFKQPHFVLYVLSDVDVR